VRRWGQEIRQMTLASEQVITPVVNDSLFRG